MSGIHGWSRIMVLVPAVCLAAFVACGGSDDDSDVVDTSLGDSCGASCINFYLDSDGDGFGSTDYQCLCAAEGQYSATASGDCDDTRAAINPGQQETCDGLDNNCDGSTDENLTCD